MVRASNPIDLAMCVTKHVDCVFVQGSKLDTDARDRTRVSGLSIMQRQVTTISDVSIPDLGHLTCMFTNLCRGAIT